MMRVRNWETYQHYSKRRPPWIKVHRKLLDSPQWFALSDEAARVLVELWLIASESEDGSIDADIPTLAFRLRRASDVLARSVKSLSDNDFLDLDSAMLAECYQLAIPEREGERETEGEQRESSVLPLRYRTDADAS